MKKVIIILCFFCAITVCAQDRASVNDVGKIALTPVILSNSTIPPEAQALVIDKLNVLVTQNGLAGHAWDERFVITINLVELYRSKTSSAPQMSVIALRPTLYIGDVKTGTLFTSYTLDQVKGTGTNDTRAYQNAFKNLHFNDPKIEQFIETGKQRIIAYYETHIGDILNQAQSYANNQQYDEAIATLMNVPEICKSQYKSAVEKSKLYYQKKINREGEELLKNAKSVWYASQTIESASKAADYLSMINPSAACSSEARQLYKQIGQKVEAINKRQEEFERKRYEDNQMALRAQAEYEHQKEMETIRALKEVGVALCSRPVTYNYSNIYWW